ncbi:response regulator [Leptolyngbya sp. FACHB-671]|uniref:ATP-binding response regulator n=1 Tax=Leptolyngbya sp. FACHB-671 TaxID=2692812 RepID=UPI0016891E7C|nr:ATP-binding protein [Leptolyngbya sp. FACHB-671]MBD2068535.1 response regulator [Leptolyngbya sp. FACHB-671]
MYVASVREFIQPTPVCAQTARLPAVLGLFQQISCERVIVTDGQRLVGTLTLHCLKDFLSKETAEVEETTVIDRVDRDYSETAIAPRQQTLQQLSFLVDQPLYEPLVELSANLPISQLAPYLKDLEQWQYALIDESGDCLGLLNQMQLLKFLVLNPMPSLQERSLGMAEIQKSLGPLNEKASAFEHPKRSPLAEPTFAESISAESISADLLIDLLERLPLPMMLQTSTGEVVARNLSWREQLGELQDPSSVGREAALLLEVATPVLQRSQPALSTESSFEPPWFLSAAQRSHLSGTWSVANSIDAMGDRFSFCHLGADLDTCVCTCPMKDGQERTWQFLKIPLGNRSTYAQFSMAALLSVVESRRRAQSGFQSHEISDFAAEPDHPAQAHSQELWLVMAQDTTEQHRVAKELTAKNADLVQLNRLKDEFLSCISHELKTPLTAVLGLSTLLKDQALGELNNRQTRYAQLIHQSGRHLVLIVNSILDLTRIETGQLELTLEPVHVKTVCDRAYEQARRLQPREESSGMEISASASEIHFDLTVQPGLETLIADELRLRQMLTNLLSNAFKFTEVGGEVGLTVEAWEGWIAFTVWDTGIGIPDEKQHLIFQKFQQLENPLTRRYEGTGLGLVLTQRLARLHGGDVTFTSVEGQGSQFTILLPPSPPQATAAETQSSVKPLAQTYSNRLMLVVEVVPRFLKDLTHQLTGLGYRVAIARSGTEALEKVRRLQPATVFLNPALPLLTGWDVLTLLKSDAETRHIPVIVTASHLEKTQAQRNGADGFLSLPIQPDALEQSLKPLTHKASEPQDAVTSLTILHLNAGGQVLSARSEHYLATHLNSLLHPHNCRMLEVDDLDQADLLAKVWTPNVVLLDGAISDPITYLRQLSEYPALAALPLVTLTAEITQAANQLPELTVFPCLASPLPDETASSNADSALLQVIQVAAGMSWAPHVLVVDVAALQQDWVSLPQSDWVEGTAPDPSAKRAAEWLQASMQYFQAAGFRSSISRSWSEVLEQIQHQSVDLLLLCVRHAEPHPSVLKALQTLAQVGTKPPILVWNCQPQPFEMGAIGEVLEAIAAQVLPPSLSMKELLDQINQTLIKR